MTWILYSSTTGSQIGTLLAEAPEPGEGEGVQLVPLSALSSPPLTVWSATAQGFVDVAVTPRLTLYQFHLLFTTAERIAIRGSANPVVQDFMALASIAQNIDLSDANLIAGVNYLEAQTLIGEGRAVEVLASQVPQ